MTIDQMISLGPELASFLREFADCFGRSEPRGKLETYVRGQLGQLPRKSVEPIALAAGMKPRTLQEFLASDEWDEDRLARHVRRLVVRDHGDDQAIGVLDESGHPKKGRHTAGVSRQYCGNTGKIDNCVMTVHLTYTSFDGRFRTMLDSSLFLPQGWHEDRERCRRAHIPDDVVYRPKYVIALEQLDRAIAEGVRFSWITADEWYAQKPAFVRGLEQRGLRFVLEIPKNLAVWLHDPATGPATSAKPIEHLCRLLAGHAAAAVGAVLHQGHRPGAAGMGSEMRGVLVAPRRRRGEPVLAGGGPQRTASRRSQIFPQQRGCRSALAGDSACGVRSLADRALPGGRKERTRIVAL